MNWYLFLALAVYKGIITGLLLDRVRLKKKLQNKLEGPTGYVCTTDYQYELDPRIKGSSVVVYNNPNTCAEAMGEQHAKECGISKVKLVKISDESKGSLY